MARRYEYRLLTHVGASAVEGTLSDLSVEGWEVVSLDWADHGMHGTVLLRRKAPDGR